MERELTRLATLLRQIAYDAGYVFLCRSDPKSARFCIEQYNRIHARLGTLDPELTARVAPLPLDAPAGEVRILARTLAAYIKEKRHREEERPWFDFGSFGFPWSCFSLKLDPG
ncbi:MAG: hypothetical protein ACE5G0_03075 [Rhodothermales bacterium]